MTKIDRIQRSQHKRGRVLIFLEGGALLKVTEQEVLDFGLRAGDTLSDDTLQRLKEAAGVSDVKTTAADLIGRRAMSRAGLEKKLREKGASEADARYAGEWLEAIGALDDAAYAAALVRHCASLGYGPARCREKLYEKGVPKDLWEEALEELPESDEQIKRFLQKKLPAHPDEKEKKRAVDALLRRGFSWADIRRGLNGYLEEAMLEDYE